MPNSQTRGADLLAQGLADADITTVFSLSGNQIMPVYDALRDTSIRIIHTRHEGAAVYMAEAAAQLGGTVGVALLTAGPGFANGLSAIYTARESETPLLVLSGDSPVARDGRGAFQELNQCAAAAPLAKASFRARRAGGLREDIGRAIALARSGRPGPVHLALPDDVLRQIAAHDPDAASVSPPPALTNAGEAHLGALAARLAEAQRPIILAGPAFCRPQWKAPLAKLANRLNVPIVTFESPRGLRAPRLGAFAEVIAEADSVVTLGKPLNFMVGFGDQPVLGPTCPVMQFDADEAILAGEATAQATRRLTQVHCQPASVVDALLAEADIRAHPANAWRRDVEAAVAFRPPAWSDDQTSAGELNSLTLASAVRTLTERTSEIALVIDGGEIGQWCQALADTETAMINGPSGAIGGSIPYAIGAKATQPDRPVVTVMGDGTAGFYLAEFETAVRENVPIIAVIGNDARWNAEHQIQVRDYGAERAFACTLTPARYDRVMAELGGYGEQVTTAAEILPAIDRALASGRPACVNVMIDGQPAPNITR